jgi:hypothetical protein
MNLYLIRIDRYYIKIVDFKTMTANGRLSQIWTEMNTQIMIHHDGGFDVHTAVNGGEESCLLGCGVV